MRRETVKIKRDTNTVYNVTVPVWEIPVLEFIFEDGNVEVLDMPVEIEREFPDARAEFDRLTRCYGADPQSGVPFVASVYGNAGTGVRALREAISKAKAEYESAAPKRSRAPRKAAEADSLLN
jgi:hypothetical protein